MGRQERTRSREFSVSRINLVLLWFTDFCCLFFVLAFVCLLAYFVLFSSVRGGCNKDEAEHGGLGGE